MLLEDFLLFVGQVELRGTVFYRLRENAHFLAGVKRRDDDAVAFFIKERGSETLVPAGAGACEWIEAQCFCSMQFPFDSAVELTECSFDISSKIKEFLGVLPTSPENYDIP